MNSVRTTLLTILFIFLCLFLYTKFLGPIPFSVNSVVTNKQDYFRVEGRGEATAVPDTALLSLGITQNGTTVVDAQQKANAVMEKLTADLKALGIEEKNIKTTNYSVYPDYSVSPSGTQNIRGYNVTQNLEVRIKPVDKANQAIDTATRAGANLVGGVSFVLDDEVKERLQDEARKEAVENAKKKAQSLAGAAGISLGRVIDVQEYDTPQIMPYGRSSSLGGDVMLNKEAALSEPIEPATEINPGENKVAVTVSLAYETH